MDEFATFIIQKANYVGFIILVALYALLNSLLLLFPFGAHVHELLWAYIRFSSVILLLDFFYVFLRFGFQNYLFRWRGWLALAGSLPIPGFSFFRLLHTGLIARKLRRSDWRIASSRIFQQRASTTLLVMAFIGIAAFEISTIFILQTEARAVDANIRTPGDAVWWAYVTFSTVGYGDRYPVTTAGRVVGLFAVTVGVALFSVVTGFLADWFRRPRQRRLRRRERTDETGQGSLPEQIAEIKRLLAEQEQTYQRHRALIEQRLEALESALSQDRDGS